MRRKLKVWEIYGDTQYKDEGVRERMDKQHEGIRRRGRTGRTKENIKDGQQA